MPLAEGEWMLSYPGRGIHRGANYVIGSARSGFPLLQPYEIRYENRSGSESGPAVLPGEDGVRFGQDRRGAASITLEVGVDTVDAVGGVGGRHGANLARVSSLSRAWDAEAVRGEFGAVCELTTMQGGRERTFFGRPQPLQPANVRFTRQGWTSVLLKFDCVDSLSYGAEQTIRVGMLPASHPGLKGPLKAPLMLRGPGASRVPGQATVAGTTPTWPVITFHGPIVLPMIDVYGYWHAQLNVTLGRSEYLTIDTRPWRRTVLRNGNANAAGWLMRPAPLLRDMRLPTGNVDCILRGTDDTGNSYMTITWRDAFAYL
ncbi:hypothetical protein [Streptomyces sp. NPDC097619]|uniref:hypothetical protein n=1 Tax=Streptomyces sp. NPDC097619 TaxID=3157228 RepID=UPI00333300F5